MRILFLIFLLIHYGPAERNLIQDTDLGSIQELYPLKIGNQWSYDFIAPESDPSKYIANYLTEEVIDTISYHGHTMFHISQQGIPTYWCYYDAVKGLCLIQDTSINYIGLGLYSPMQIGQRIILRDTVLDSNHLHKETLTLKEANVPVTTEAGLFYCSHFLKEMYHGEIYHPDSTMTDTWYAKGVGLIRERYSKWLNGKKIDRGGMDLKSYKVN